MVGKGPSTVGIQPFQRVNPENTYSIPRGYKFCNAAPQGTPKLRFYSTVATIFIMPKGGDTQILILSYRCQSICCALTHCHQILQ
jgi:hypothetical protein